MIQEGHTKDIVGIIRKQLLSVLNNLYDTRSEIEFALDQENLLKTAEGKQFYKADKFLDSAIIGYKDLIKMLK